MCGLCGVFLTETHWADSRRVGSRERRAYPQARAACTASRWPTVILKHYGLKVSDWQGSAYLLASQTGQTSVVPSIAAVWPAAEQWRRRTLDPLDEALIQALERD